MAGALTGVLEASYQASGDVTRSRFVVLTGDQLCARASVQGSEVLGVAGTSVLTAGPDGRNEVAAGKGTDVAVLGNVFIESGASFSRGADLMTDSSGRAIAATATNRVAAKAAKAAGGAGELVPCYLVPYGGQRIA